MDEQYINKKTKDALFRLVLTSTIAVMICVGCLCMTTFAWFTNTVEAPQNQLQVSSPSELSVSICYANGEEIKSISAKTINQTTLVCNGTYKIVLTLPADSASGYLIITDGANSYYSNFLQRNESKEQMLTFTLVVESEKTLTFDARWGIFGRDPDVFNGGTLTIS